MFLFCKAIANNATDICSPVDTRASYSLRSGLGFMSLESLISSSVLLPIAESTTTTSLPSSTDLATRSATASIRSALATDVPPNFFTINLFMRTGF